jgi:hypothetical protein
MSAHATDFFFVPLIAFTVCRKHPDFSFSLALLSCPSSQPSLPYELYTTGEVRFYYSHGDLARTIQKALFFPLQGLNYYEV